jgi:hypothetical protein
MTVAARGAPDLTQTPHSCHRLVKMACIFGSEMSGSNFGTDIRGHGLHRRWRGRKRDDMVGL